MLLWKSKLVKMTRAAKVIWQQHSVTDGLKWLHSHGAGCGLGHVSPEGLPGLLHLVPKAAGERTRANMHVSSHLHWPLGISKSCRGSGEGVKRGERHDSLGLLLSWSTCPFLLDTSLSLLTESPTRRLWFNGYKPVTKLSLAEASAISIGNPLPHSC